MPLSDLRKSSVKRVFLRKTQDKPSRELAGTVRLPHAGETVTAERAGAGGRVRDTSRSIPILTYHSIDDSGSVLSTPVETFRRHLATVHGMGLTTVQVSDIAACIQDRKDFPPHAIALTFDDGFAGVYEHAFPLLYRYGFLATVFLVTDYCGKRNGWPGQPAKIPRLPLLEWPWIQEMSRHGIQFGAHTKTHPDLRRLSSGHLKREVFDSKMAIEDRLGQAVDSFAYPYGHLDARTLAVVRDHFLAACTTELAFVRDESNPWCLERVDAYYLRSRLFPRYLRSPLARAYLHLRRTLRGIRNSHPLAKPTVGLVSERGTA